MKLYYIALWVWILIQWFGDLSQEIELEHYELWTESADSLKIIVSKEWFAHSLFDFNSLIHWFCCLFSSSQESTIICE